MLACALLLLLFLAEWIRSQYHQEAKRLDEDLQSVFARTEEGLADSLLNQMIIIALDTLTYQSGPKVYKQGSVNKRRPTSNKRESTSSHPMEITIATLPGKGEQSQLDSLIKTLPASPERQEIDVPSTLAGNTQKGIVSMSASYHSASSQQLSEELKKVFRIAIKQLVNINYATDTSFNVNSLMMMARFGENIKEKYPELITSRINSPTDSIRLFTYHQVKNPTAAIAVKNYQPIVWKAILPQMAFSALLLLLIGLAFALAYRTMKQQAIFNRQKDSFISNISHELKTPVATTKVALEALTTYDALESPDRTRKYLNVATWQMNRLSTMIERIMNMLQLENGNVYLQKSQFRFAALVEEIIRSLEPVLTEKGITLTWENKDKTLEVFADRTHIEGTLYNLLDNAIKYGGELIELHMEAYNNKLRLRISDNGPGIRPEYHKKIFENFFRIPSNNRHDIKGHGLGLSYARDIVKAHDGTIHVNSDLESGTTFVIILPIIAIHEL